MSIRAKVKCACLGVWVVLSVSSHVWAEGTDGVSEI